MSTSDTKEHYVIVGFGWVGQANALALKILGHDVSYFDPAEPQMHYKEEYNEVYTSLQRLSSVTEADSKTTWYFVCVGDKVGEDGTQDISAIQSTLSSLKGIEGKVVLRSTILPDLLEGLAFDYYVPEFLHEQKAVEECIHPYLFVVGKKSAMTLEPSVFKQWSAESRRFFKGTPREASFVKYLSNIWNATRIAFVNEFGDTIAYPKGKEELSQIEKVIDFVCDGGPYLRYGRSFGGHCLPKDTRAFRAWFQKKGNPLPLISGVYESNALHASIEKEQLIVPEWFSKWPDARLSGKQAITELSYSIKKHIRNPRLFLKFFRASKNNIV